MPSQPTVSAISLEDVVQHFYKTAPTKRRLSLGITEGPNIKRRKMKPEETDSDGYSSSSGGENLHNVELQIFTS